MMNEKIDYSIFSPEELLERGIKTERREKISVDNITEEDALVDPTHAENLSKSMVRDRGQISPATVRARFEDDGRSIVYDIVDGFHRREGKKNIQEESGIKQELDSIVLYGCSDEELFDLRVLAANSVASVKFARMAEWMKGSLQNTKWENDRIGELIKRGDITLSQIFNLTVNDASGRNLGLKEEEVVEIKAWVERKSIQWNRPIRTLMNEIRTIEKSAPDLVRRVRKGRGRGSGEILTKLKLDVIVKNLPGDWEVQRRLANLAIEKDISTSDLDFLAWYYAYSKEISDHETMAKILEQPVLLLYPPVSEDQTGETKTTTQSTPLIPIRQRKNRRTVYSRKDKGKKEKIQVNEEEIKEGQPDEELVLRKHRVPEIIDRLTKTILEGKNDKLTLLFLPKGDLVLDIKRSLITMGEEEIRLNDRERNLMLILSLLEGYSLTEEILTMSSLDSNGYSINIEFAIEELKRKISAFSKGAAEELKHEKGKYSWLTE